MYVSQLQKTSCCNKVIFMYSISNEKSSSNTSYYIILNSFVPNTVISLCKEPGSEFPWHSLEG